MSSVGQLPFGFKRVRTNGEGKGSCQSIIQSQIEWSGLGTWSRCSQGLGRSHKRSESSRSQEAVSPSARNQGEALDSLQLTNGSPPLVPAALPPGVSTLLLPSSFSSYAKLGRAAQRTVKDALNSKILWFCAPPPVLSGWTQDKQEHTWILVEFPSQSQKKDGSLCYSLTPNVPDS